MRLLFPSASIFLWLCTSAASFSQLMPNEPKNVAIFLYEGVELLDFAGPGEVFSASGFKTYTVSVDGKELISQKFVKIKPEYSIENAPIPDIIVFPGGNSSPSANNTTVIEWIKNSHARGTNFFSVCTGAFIIARAGLLENKRVTTHWGAIKNLATQYPTATVLEDTRWVDNGFVITTAGVSAGIDGALHLVARIKGNEAAQRTARYMEYDKWNPENGVVDVKNSRLETLITTSDKKIKLNELAPFAGEYLNYANLLVAKDDLVTAKRVIEEGIAVYPKFDELYKVLRAANQKSGEPVPVDESELIGMIRDGKIDQALALYERDKKAFPGWRIFGENAMNDAAYFLLVEKKDTSGAIKIFTLNTREFPDSPNTFDSLGEAQLLAGHKKAGIENYRKAAAMGYENAVKLLRDLDVK